MTRKFRVLRQTLILTALAGVACHGAPKPPTLTEHEADLLKLDQKDAIIAKQQLDQVQAQFSSRVDQFNKDCIKIKADDKWPAAAFCDINNATITMPSAATPATPTTAPAPPTSANKK